jgi:cytidylate kinase
MLVITLYAELGTDGEYIGRAAAERLGLAYVDRALLARAVEDALAEGQEVPEYNLARGRWVRQIANRALMLARSGEKIAAANEQPAFVAAGTVSEERYLRLLQAALLELSRAGRVLITGRGAEALLRDQPTSIHARVVAPLERRVSRVMELLRADRTVALEAIEHADSVHSGYLKYAMNVNWTDPSLYDLTINAARFPADHAVEMIVAAASVLGYRRRTRRGARALPEGTETPALPETTDDEEVEETAAAGRGR